MYDLPHQHEINPLCSFVIPRIHFRSPALRSSKQSHLTIRTGEESKAGDIIQLAECSKNTRVAKAPQHFAIFVLTTDNDKDTIAKGGPYGRCFAFACGFDQNQKVTWIKDERAVSFFWDSDTSGNLHYVDASNCIKDPDYGTCGCELSGSGTFCRGHQDCPVTNNGGLPCGKPTFRRCGYELDGYGVGLWNTDPCDKTPPGNPVGACWEKDFDRHQQPLRTWDAHICVPGSNQVQAEGSLGQAQGLVAAAAAIDATQKCPPKVNCPPDGSQSVLGGTGQLLGPQNNNQLYTRQNTGVGGFGLDGSFLQGTGGLSQSLASSGLSQLLNNCGANNGGGGGGGTGSSLYGLNSGVNANQLAGANLQSVGNVGGGSVLRNGLDNSLAGSGAVSGDITPAGFTPGQCPGSVGPPGGAGTV